MFSGISGLRNHQTMMDVVGNNIANVNTTGYKSMRATFQESLTQVVRGGIGGQAGQAGCLNPLQLGLGTRMGTIDGVFGQGAVQVTGRTTDLAIQGNGFFVVDTAEGVQYSRAGNFSWDSAGQLVGPGGERVQIAAVDADGVPVVPAAVLESVDLDAFTNVLINNSGQIVGRDAAGDPQVIGQIRMATFANPNGLERAGSGLYAATDASGAAIAGFAGDPAVGTLSAGTLEMSNVDLAQEFTSLILAQRGFQANSRTITSSDEMLQDLVNLKR
jgi:flagellar hook protein FlgE